MDITAKVTKNVQADQDNKLQYFPNKIVQITDWKQVNVLFFRQIDIAQFHHFSLTMSQLPLS